MIKSVIASVAGSVRESLKKNASAPVELPIFPPGSVLFPGGTLRLKVFEQRYLEMAKTCLKSNSPFGISLIREGEEVGMPAVPESIGTAAQISEWDMQELGILQLRVKGAARFKIVSHSVLRSGLIVAQVSMLADDTNADSAEYPACANFLRKVLTQTGAGDEVEEQNFDDAAWVGFRITELLPFSTTIKQKMLELTDANIRLQILHQFLTDQRLVE
ncbi:MAG: LON peptidase substrate-binding domain-containing protein [Usitatibacteraceae bacterium]